MRHAPPADPVTVGPGHDRYPSDVQDVITIEASAERRAEVLRFCGEVAGAHGHAVLSDHLRLELADPDATPTIALAHRQDRLVGVAVVSAANQSLVIEVATGHLHDQPAPTDLVTGLVTALVRRIRESDHRPITWWVRAHDPWADAVARTCGFRPDRRLFQMRVRLDADLLERLEAITVPTRAFRPGLDDAEWLRVNNRAFSVHGEQGDWDEVTLRRRLTAEWFDAEGFRLHDDHDRLVAFCWTKLHAPNAHDDALGEIYVIAVDPDHIGRGLGRALTAAGLLSIASRGIDEAMLYVDADNEPAVALYRSLGMEVHHVDRSFVLDPGTLP